MLCRNSCEKISGESQPHARSSLSAARHDCLVRYVETLPEAFELVSSA